ncbi:MAG: hypothetical protein ACOCWY_05545 [Thermodesulfobacteriota bacterium]
MAKKKKTKIPRRLRKKFQKRKMSKQIIEESRKRLLEKAKTNPLAGTIEVADDPPAKKKMSDVIITYAAPLLAKAASREDQRTALHMAVWFWNYTLMSPDAQSEEKAIMDKRIRAGERSREAIRLIEETLPYMVERKKELFSDNQQVITDYEIVDTPEGVGLSVAYAMRKDRK